MPRQRWPANFFSVGVLLFVHGFAAEEFYQDDSQYKDLRIGNEWEPRSRMIMVDGNIYFHAGRNKNITFLVTPGSSISFGPTNILDLANGTEVQAMRAAIQQTANDMNQWRQQAVVDERTMTDTRRRLVELNGRVTATAAVMRQAKNETRVRSRALRNWSRELKKTTEALEKILKLIATNECLQAPCKNGATCVDLVGKYQCLCPPGWQGEQCDERVDECALYHNTSLGCPQNVTCVNNANTTGFHCLCPVGWHGHLCQTKRNSCDQSDGVELCGEHGHCIPFAGANGGPGYKCLCEAGYELNGDAMNPECIDKNECRDAPCYLGAECLNLPGSFQCTSCPRGMIGNGINCHDYDECARDETNDCSKSPRVECINKHGSYECGSCPTGYSGDGYQCSRLSPCSEGLNPCWSEAECREEPYQYCICPRGMSGDGVGPLGCQSDYRDACHNAEGSGSELCYNGATCQSFPDWSYKCHCAVGYWGDRCEKSNGCLDEEICSRHGRCLMEGNETATTCECLPGYYGDRCQYEEEGCSFHTTNASGYIFFDRSSLKEKHITTRECTWSIQLLDVRKVLKLTFENFTVPNVYNVTSRGCERSFGNLTIFESIDADAAAEIGNFCYGENAISLQHPIYTSGSQALVRLTTRIQIPQTQLSIKWEAVQPRCGRRLGAGQLEGRIDYYPGAQPEGGEQDNCVWYITVPPQYHIEIRVARVAMLSGEGVNCSLNALDVYDNQAVSERTRMASICESRQSSTLLRTSSNHAVVHLRMDSSASLQAGQVGFTLTYKALELPAGCGGEIQASPDGRLEGELASPNYGHQYFPNLDCLWILNVSSVVANSSSQSTDDMKVGIEFVDFDVATSVTSYSSELIALPGITFTNCLGDFVEVPELYQTFCNLHKPPSTLLTAPVLSVRLHTDATVGGRGFLLKYKSLCQKDFTAPNGTIKSPNYPEIARTAFKCTYRIVAQSQQAIKIKLSSIGLHLDAMSCFYRRDLHAALDDYIELSGGHPSNEALNKRYVCARYPFLNGDEIVTSGVRPFEITYSASGDEKRRNKGFMFEYQLLDVGCGGVFFSGGYGEVKRVTSPNYPDDYLSHMYCVYHLGVSEGKAIRITFAQFDLENVGSESGNCTFDNLRIFDSFADENNHGELLGTFCGVSTPPPLLSASGRMVLVFKSDRSLAGTGFSLDFQPVDLKSDCDRTFTAPSGEISFDPADYAKDLATECTYHIQLPSNRRILLRFANISLPCDDGTLEVRNGATQESPGFPGLYGDSEVCNDHPVEQLMSQGNRLFIRFASLNPQANYHFRLQYEQLDSACGGHISGMEGAFSAPQYPQKDSRELECEWHVTTAEGNRLELEFVAIDDLDSENAGAGGCSLYGRNVITVIEAPPPSAGISEEVVLKRYCSKQERAKPLLLDGNQAVVKYTQHGGAYSKAIFGFLAKFTTRCMSVELAGQHGTLQSPGYPTRVLIDRHCKWRIRVAPGNRIRLTFHLFRISNPTTIRSGRGSAALVRVGGGRRRRPLVLNTQPDERLNRCGDNYLTFAPEDVAEIYGSGESGSALRVMNESMPRPAFFCNGVAEPREVLTTSNSVEVLFISDRGEPENHFWLTWTSVGCGGNGPMIANNSRLLVNASVDFAPASLKSLRLCQWDIVAPIGYRVHIAVENLWAVEMGPGDDCYNHSETNGLRLYSLHPPPYAVGSKSPPPHETYCRVGGGSGNFSSPSSELSIVYALNTTLAPPPTLKGVVFNATVTFLPAKVATNKVDFSGRIVHVTRQASSMVQSPNYPNAFPKGAEAIWQFETPEGYSVGYRLLDYHVGRDYRFHDDDDADDERKTASNGNYTCPYSTAFLRGYLAFLEGPYDRYLIHYGLTTAAAKRSRVIQKICADVDSPGIEIRTESNVSTLVFRASPYDVPERAENDSKPLGFQLRVMAFCGGRLFASAERKSINLAPIVDGESRDCEWEIARDPTDDEESETIYLRIEQIGAKSAATSADSGDSLSGAQFEIFCSGVSKGVLETSLVLSITDSHFKQYQCESTMRLVAKNLNQQQSFLVSYDMEASFCGGTVTGEEGTITLTEVAYGTECEWTLETVPGSRVEFELLSLQLPQSEFCSESYLLIRDSNATGVVLGGKYCGEAAGVASKIERQSLWIRLRHGSPNERSSEESARQAATLSMRYKKVYGGFTLSSTIVMPANVEGARRDYYSWRISAKQPGNFLRIEVVEFMVEGDDYSLSFYDIQCEPMRVQSSQEVCSDYDDRATQFEAGYDLVDGEAYSHTMQSSGATIVFKPGTSRGGFKLHWTEIEPAEANRSTAGVLSAEEGEADSGWTCGGELVAEYEPKILESPTVLGQYKNDERCKWRIRKPRFSSIVLKLKSIDLEEHYTCRYDYIIISGREYATAAELSEAPGYNKLCRKRVALSGMYNEYTFAYDAFVYFYSDHSERMGGFKIEYSLSCAYTSEYISSQDGMLDEILSSPGYPLGSSSAPISCRWNMYLVSGRDVSIESIDMDLAGRDTDGECRKSDALQISDDYYFERGNTTYPFCGQDRVNLTMKHGNFYIKLATASSRERRRGFKLRIRELAHDCSSGLGWKVDEASPVKTISSLNFPGLSPNSLDCQWTLSAPIGRRLSFTVDPHKFSLEGTATDGSCEEDFLEIRDGASQHSPLVGRYCRANPPSTILSTGSYLHLRYVTDSQFQSNGWNATFELATCGGTLILQQGVNGTIASPNYPKAYPSSVECEWFVQVPRGHFVEAHVDHLWLQQTDTNCTGEYLLLREGNSSGAVINRPMCSRWMLGAMPYRSSSRSLYVKFSVETKSPPAYCYDDRCGFQMHFAPSKYECGGTVTDSEGKVYPPGYPDKLLPHVTCQWDFRAGIQHRYVLTLEFVNRKKLEDPSRYLEAQTMLGYNTLCYHPLEVWNGNGDWESGRRYAYSLFDGAFKFCANASTFVTETDMATLRFDGISEGPTSSYYDYSYAESTQLHNYLGPFHVKYTRVERDFDNRSCMHEITEPTTIHIGDMRLPFYSSRSEYKTRNSKSFCHLQIRKPEEEQTVHLEFTDFRAGRNSSLICDEGDSRVVISGEHLLGDFLKTPPPPPQLRSNSDDSDTPFEIDTILCNGTLRGRSNKSLAFVNQKIDIYVYNDPYISYISSSVNFNLSVSFSNCGGVIDEAGGGGMSGSVESPGFGAHDNYTNGLECLWVLNAPQGKVVSLQVEFMDLEHHIECANDFLEVSEGSDRLAVLHRYCNEMEVGQKDADAVPDIYRRIKSRGRMLTLVFSTDDTIVKRGFRLRYEFVAYEEGVCGFHSRAVSGSIHSPGYPSADYPPNQQCLWDLSVPSGYHIRLTFDSMDIEETLDCKKDSLQVTYEQVGRGMAPVGTYYFYFDHQESLQPMCGLHTPPAVELETQRVRVNFTSDSTISGRGFSMHWEVVCGSVYKMSHGVITSPHYPHFYPNENMECRYLIDPDTNGVQIITLSLLDFDLDGESLAATRSPCSSDFLEVLDVNKRNQSVMRVCGSSTRGSTSSAISVKGPIGLRFVTNSSYAHGSGRLTKGSGRKDHRGFKITYAVADCGGNIELTGEGNRASASISSPGFPLPYHHGLDCLWNISAPADRIIAYKYTSMDLEWNRGCSFDYVEVFDGAEISNTTRVTKLCGKTAPEGQQTTKTNRMLVRFVTDPSGEREGFKMAVTATLGQSRGCGGELWAASGTAEKELQPPIDPATGKYYPDLRCLWTIRAKERNKLVQLVIKQLELEVRNNSSVPGEGGAAELAGPDTALESQSAALRGCFDFIAIYDGPKKTSPMLLHPTCSLLVDELHPPRYTSSYRMVDLYFESDASTESRGFTITYKAVEPECGGKYEAGVEFSEIAYKSAGTLTRSDQQHQRCRFYFYSQQTESGMAQPIEINFKQFSFPSTSQDCSEEWMEIRDAGSVAECSHPACAKEQQYVSGTLKTCGVTLPPTYVSRTSVVQVTTSAIISSQVGANFTLQYRLLDSCNRTIDLKHFGSPLASGRLTSPHYPNQYGHNQSCDTYITAPKDHLLLLVFRDFHMEGRAQGHMERGRHYNFGVYWNRQKSRASSFACSYDLLTVYHNSSNPTQNFTYCGSSLPPSVLSTGNQLTLALRTDPTVSHSGYEAFYCTVAVSSLTLSRNRQRQMYELSPSREKRGALTSIGYPNGYEANMLQRAVIIPPPGQKCMAQVLRTDFGTADCGDHDYAHSATAPIDTSGRSGGSGGRIDYNRLQWSSWECRTYYPTKLPIPFGHMLIVEFITDGDKNNDGKGFRMIWDCEDFKTILI